MQKTIVFEYNGKKHISKPFSFKHACIIDDQMYKDHTQKEDITNTTINLWAFPVIQKMFEGTELTDEIIEYEINSKELRNACRKVFDWYLGIDEEVKNS